MLFKKMIPDTRVLRLIAGLLGHLVFAFLFVLAVLFYKERTLYVDPAHHLFTMIKNENFYFYHARYSVVFYQWLPILAIKMNSNLKTVALLFSISMIFWQYMMFLYAQYRLKDLYTSFAIILAACLLTRHTFYAIYETSAGIVLLPLLWAHLNRLDSEKFLSNMIAVIILTVSCLFFHLGILIALTFILVYWFLLHGTAHLKPSGVNVDLNTEGIGRWYISDRAQFPKD